MFGGSASTQIVWLRALQLRSFGYPHRIASRTTAFKLRGRKVAVAILETLRAVFHLTSWGPDSFLLIAATGFTAYCAAFNGVVLSRLMWGQHSYDSMEEIWKQVLSVSFEAPVEKKGTR